MPKIDLASVLSRKGSGYPEPYSAPCAGRIRRRLGDAGGLRDFGVNLTTLPPGGWSSQRHWHSHEDEFVHVLEEFDGSPTLIAVYNVLHRLWLPRHPPRTLVHLTI